MEQVREQITALLSIVKRSLNPSYRIICFPHGGGGVESFRAWSDYIPDDVELICLNFPGRGRRSTESAIRSMGILVDVVGAALREYSDRPFIFFGHSVGALVAYEMARSLEKAGRPSPFHVVVSAHKSADVPADEPPMYRYGDDRLADLVRSLGLVPEEALANEELLHNFILPALRADFELDETYDRSLPTPLNAAITAMGGFQDELLNANDLSEWRRLTTARFARIMFASNHFYTHSMAAEVVSTLLREVGEVRAQLTASIRIGEALPYPELPLHEQFRKQAAVNPEASAVVSEAGILTYRELDDLSEILSRHLLEQGQSRGSRVGILMDASPEYAVALFGILKAGAAYVVLDKAQPVAALKRTLEKVNIEFVVTSNRFAANLSPNWSGITLSLDEGWEVRLDKASPTSPQAVDLDAPAQIVFSSGTTGEPKWIVCPHRSAVCSHQWRYHALPYAANEREAVNIFLVWEIMRPILAGVPAYLVPDDVIYDPYQLVEYLGRYRISRIMLTPSILNVLLNSIILEAHFCLPDLRLIYLSGEVVTAVLLARVRCLLPQVKIINCYRTAEAYDVTHIDLSEIDPAITQKAVPVGPPQHNVSVYILGEQRDPVPLGFLGEVFVGGDALSHGYLDSPEMTRERFFPDPFRADGTMFRTGDLGHMLPGGELEIIGRYAFMVKIRGYSVVPEAVEAALLRYSGVCSAAVLPELDPKTGQPDQLIAYVVLRDKCKGWEAALRAHLKSEVPPYAIPSEFVTLNELPVTANGKLHRSRLRDVAQEVCTSVTGADEVESALRAAWRDLLQAEAADPGDNFFDFGGHSLLAARLCMQLRESLKVELRVVEVFLSPTFKELAALLRRRRSEQGLPQNLKLPKTASVSTGRAHIEAFDVRRGPAMDIAVIGMAARFPGAETVDALWENLCQGVCSIAPLSVRELKARGIPEAVLKRSDYVRVGAHLSDVHLFDPDFWNLSSREATLMDPQHRLFLECCWQALESAGYAPAQHEGRTGVFAGSSLPLYLIHHLKGGGLIELTNAPLAFLTKLGNDKDYLASRVSYMLNLNGPSIAVQTACSTGLVAIAVAAQSLAAGYCDMALAGAASIAFPQVGYQHVEGFINSSDGVCRAFDADGGTVLGDGVGVVVLKRLEDALAAADPIHAVVRGCAINNDGRTKSSFSAPSAQGQAAVVRQALASAALCAEDVEYVETHGTGTKIGDPVEVRALAEVFATQDGARSACALGSIKPNIGHSGAAAGVASFIKTVLSLQKGLIPPTINIKRLNQELNLEETSFFVNEQLRPWPRKQGRARTAGVTGLGTGGTNCHVVLQEWMNETVRAWPGSIARGSHALCLSAKTPSALSRACRNLATFLRRNRDVDLGDVAQTLRMARCHFDHRVVIVARNLDMAIKRLEEEADGATDRIRSSPSIAFMLPGGGVQYKGMFKDLFDHVSDFREPFLICVAATRSVLDRDVASLIFGENDGCAAASFEEINVMIFSVQYAMACLLEACGVHPDYLVGHSMSEYVVAALAGILNLDDAVALMCARGRAMANLGVDGAMLAAKCSPDEAERILEEDTWRDRAEAGEISVGVVNSKTSVVFTGKRELIQKLQEALDKAEIPNQVLETAGVPSHSPLMKPAADIIDAHVRALGKRVPELPISLNSGGYLHRAKVPLPETYWSRQASGTIRFDRSLAAIVAAGATALIDLGPSCNLARFAHEAIDSADGKTRNPAIFSAAHGKDDLKSTDRHVLLECLGDLWSLGVAVDWERASDQLEPFGSYRRISLPTYSFDRHRCWPDGQPTGLTVLPQTEERERRRGEVFIYGQSWTEKVLPRAVRGDGSAKVLRWLVFADQPFGRAERAGDALANSITRLLEDEGHEVVRICRRAKPSNPSMKVKGSIIMIDPTRRGLKALFDAEIASGRPADRILCLWHLHGCAGESGGPNTVQTNLLRSYEAMVDLARVLSALPFQAPVDVWIVGDRMVQVGEEAVDPEKACAFGPTIVLPQENPIVDCRVVDLNIDEPGATDRLFAEIRRDLPSPDALVALRGNRRWVPHFPEVTLAARVPGQEILRPEGVYLITGALGRIGLSLTEYLVKLGATVVAVTRRAVPALLSSGRVDLQEDGWMGRLAALENAKGRVIFRQADVSNFDRLASVFDVTIRECGRIDGIFHAAALCDPKFLSEMEDATSADEFASKVIGTRNLYNALKRIQSTRTQGPEFVFLFSSLASVLGGPARAAYAAANCFMDAFVRQVPGKVGTRWISSNWDDWDYSCESQVTARYAISHAKEVALGSDEAIDIIERILATVDYGQVIVATRPLPPRIRQWVDQVRTNTPEERPDEEEISSGEEARKGRGDLGGGDPKSRFLQEVRLLLGTNEIGFDDNFFDVGGNSLLAAALQVGLTKSDCWRSPQLGEIFKAGTFGELYDRISRRVGHQSQ